MLLVESFVYMDVCVANNMTADILIDTFSAGTPRDGTESPGEVCFRKCSPYFHREPTRRQPYSKRAN